MDEVWPPFLSEKPARCLLTGKMPVLLPGLAVRTPVSSHNSFDVDHLAEDTPSCGRVCYFFTKATAWATTLSTLKPKRLSTSGPGAEAPKRSTLIVAPSSPTQRDQPREEPASIASRTLTSRGSTWSRYSCDCSRNSSQQGMEITLARIPFSVESFS